MGAVVTAVSGFDVGYAARQAAREPEKSPLGYYANAAQAGEAPGRWFGAGLQALGLAEGQTVEADPETESGAFYQVYQQVNPATGEKIGRAPVASGPAKAAYLEQLLAAEPHATRERHRQLARAAAHQARQSPPYTDVTVSFSKSISVLHASIRENERRARLAGDECGEAYWAAQDRRFQDVLQAANLVALRHAERWAATRTGYHGRKVDGQEQGRWEQALPVVSTWLQGTSRDGDPHDHLHNMFARMALTAGDGKWRSLDTMALRNQLPAMQAIAAAHAEAGLSREFGVRWAPRADGAGNEISGVTQAQMDLYSSRARDIEQHMPAKVEQFIAGYGRPPNQRELLYLRNDVWAETRDAKDEGAIDWRELAREWDARAGGALAQIAPAVGAFPARGTARNDVPRGSAPAPEALARAARQALAHVQAARATWTRADLVKHLGLALPPETRAMEPEAAVALLHEVADRALAGEFEPVASMSAPEWPALPDYLVRELDGASVYTRPGSERYTTRVQLSIEEQLVRDAQCQGAPRLAREDAARLIGADADALDAQLRERAQDARAGATGSGLRLDQGAALYHVLTSPRVAEVLVGPAGSGKTRTLAEAARAWQTMGGDVIGLATSQGGRNVLARAGVQLAENTSIFLGHLPGRRGARGITDLAPGALILIDEASMTSTADLRDIIAHAARAGHKVIVCGDHAQLTAVESGGGMGLLVAAGGHVQLAEAVRFRETWEQEASLRLRQGEAAVLDEYDDHGRIRGGAPADAMADARRLYVARYIEGQDVELIVSRRELGREMARQIRSDLRHLGLAGSGREVRIAKGQRAGAGDVIRATRNHRKAGIANGDILRIEAVNADGSVTVRRGLDRDPETGARRWAAEAFRWRRYGRAESGYWATAHAAQGRTVSSGIALVTGSEDAQWLYSAMTRGAESNIACVFTHKEPADPSPGTRAAPELARERQVQAERAARPEPEHGGAAAPCVEPREPAAVLADVIARDARERSALETRRRNLANADHLGKLATIWEGETRDLRIARYRQAVAGFLPPGREAELDSRQATWLWRTLRAAEAAGLDVRDVAARALQGRPLDGARSLPAVIDARIRKDAGALLPAPWRPWSEQVPEVADPVRRRFLTELAAAMDARKDRLGEHAAAASPEWAVRALGQVPDDPIRRLEWERWAAHISAYREMFGYEHPADAVGMEPSGDSPEKRAAWHAAHAAITRTDEVTIGEHADSRLWLMRDTYEAETRWAPGHPADRLRQLRSAVIDSAALAARSDAEAEAARRHGNEELAARHETIAASARAARGWYSQRAEVDAAVMDDYRAWSQVTAGSRHLAVLADAELRRRHPDLELAPLRSAEPEPPAPELPAMPETEADAAAMAAAAERERAAFRERLEERQGVVVPDEDPDMEPLGEAWPLWPGRGKDAILQPPPPEIPPASRLLEREAALEAGG